ncbi:hypothetical protein BGZ57DRAFT_924713 [Hyaloscypha finlandica]|nr:hypothetical protein BGZ57DRAFT_924713 [Hyaloscypha finlandica]
MTVVQDGGNSVQSLPSDSILYECMKDKTKTSLRIVALVIFYSLHSDRYILYWTVLLLIVSKHALFRVAKRNHRLKNIMSVPDSKITISWMLQAGREQAQGSSSRSEGISKQEEDLRDWDFIIVNPT